MLKNETTKEFIDRRFQESSILPEKYQRLVDDDSEWKIFCIQMNENGGKSPYRYVSATKNKYLRAIILLHIWRKEHYFSLWQHKKCMNCNFEYKLLIVRESSCPNCEAPSNFDSNKIDKWLEKK